MPWLLLFLLSPGSSGFKAQGKLFEVKSTSGKLLFSADEQEVVVGADRLRVMGEWRPLTFDLSDGDDVIKELGVLWNINSHWYGGGGGASGEFRTSDCSWVSLNVLHRRRRLIGLLPGHWTIFRVSFGETLALRYRIFIIGGKSDNDSYRCSY